MAIPVAIDAIDDQILHMLLKDARQNLKEIAKECGVSTVSVLNRINRLKKLGVITGATLFTSLNIYNYEIIAFIGIETENDADVNEILRFLRENTCLVEPSLSIGKFDLHAVIYTKDFNTLNDRVGQLRGLNGIRKVVVSVWSELPAANHAKLDLMPHKRKNING